MTKNPLENLIMRILKDLSPKTKLIKTEPRNVDTMVRLLIRYELTYKMLTKTLVNSPIFKNRLFTSFLNDSYITSVTVTIRRLFNEGKINLNKSWNTLYKERKLFNRYNFVTLYKNKYGDLSNKKTVERHKTFDKLSCVKRITDRNIQNGKDDKICEDWWSKRKQMIDALLNSNFYKNFANKTIAHNVKSSGVFEDEINKAIDTTLSIWSSIGILTLSFPFQPFTGIKQNDLHCLENALMPQKYKTKAIQNWNTRAKELAKTYISSNTQ